MLSALEIDTTDVYPSRLEIFERILADLPRLPLIDLGAGHCKFSRIAHTLGFPVTSLDGRDERVPDDIEWPFIRQDVRNVDLSPYGIICILGLLYHMTLEDQDILLRKCVGKIVIVDTETAPTERVRGNRYAGLWWEEVENPKSSIANPYSFWHTQESLRRFFADHGFETAKVESEHAPGRAFWLLKPAKYFTDIVIAHYGVTDRLTDLCCACLRSIAKHSTHYRVIFVDNASPQFDAIQPELSGIPHLLIRHAANEGFIRATNAGLTKSTAPYVVLLNNDTEAVPSWLEKLRAPLLADSRIGLVGPRTTTPGSWQGRAPAGKEYKVLNPGAMLAYFCVMLRRELLDAIGPLNEAYGVGFGDDDDHCRRAQRAGWKLALVQDLVIPHHHRSTFHAIYTPEQVRSMQAQALEHYRKTG